MEIASKNSRSAINECQSQDTQPKTRQKFLLLTGICLILAFHSIESQAVSAQAKPLQSLKSIHQAIKQFIRLDYRKLTKIEIRVGLNDQRLRLSRCDQPLTIFWRSQAQRIGNTAVGVRCEGSVNWTIYAPVRIKVYKKIAIAGNNLLKGQALKLSDIKLEQRDVSHLVSGYISQATDYIGYELKRPVHMGQTLSPNMLNTPKLIRRGEQVTLLAKPSGIEVRMQGKALSSGGAGDIVKIRNLSSNRIIEGTVVATGIVKVHL